MKRFTGQRGHALLITALITVVIMGFGLTMVTSVTSASEEQSTAWEHVQRLYTADSGLQAAVLDLSRGGSGTLASELAPIPFNGGGFWTSTTDNGDHTYTVLARGRHGGQRRVIQALVRETGHAFHHAVFAGNDSEDPNYVMDFGGVAGQADAIHGDLFSGGSINVWGDATISGSARAADTVVGVPGEAGVTQPPMNFSGMNYPSIADVLVKDAFDLGGSFASDDAGGSAWQLPETDPAHIFRKNPSDRATEIGGTVKDDYFLEDPYEVVRADSTQDGSDPYHLSLGNAAGASGVRRLFYIDGNLWIHNSPTYSFMFDSVGSDGVQVTFVVKGNVYFSDNLFLDNPDKDGMAFIALRDPGEPDSGNIYFGDPSGGTLEEMHAFMYAENDFIDHNLDAAGSKNVLVKGTMAAGNHVAINRTYGTEHSQLVVEVDPRVKNGDLSLPGIPQQQQQLSYEVAAWLEVSSHE